MKTTHIFQKGLIQIRNILKKIVIAIVSGIPRNKVSTKPEKKSIIYQRQAKYKATDRKYYHRPLSHTTVEQQILMKEKRKAKVHE